MWHPFFLLVAAGTLAAQQPSLELLNATLWQQKSIEYQAAATQTYRAAEAQLQRAMKDKRWTAALEQTPEEARRRKQKAIILDVDETVLDNTPAQARQILESPGGAFDPRMWDAWTRERRARAVPGAAEFLNAAARRGVAIFYVTNREESQQADTAENLRTAGLPVTSPAFVLCRVKGESDKAARRRAVATNYRILMLFGDDLNDFLPVRVSPEERSRLVQPHQTNWGQKWFVLPNPMYGSWEDSLLGFNRSLSPAEKIKKKLDLLDLGRQ